MSPSDAAAQLAADLRDARARTLEMASGLDEEQLMGPCLAIVNPMRWELGHVGWFHERWMLRHARGEEPLRADGDALYDSAKVAHDTRWHLPLPSMPATLAYAAEVLDRAVERLASGALSADDAYFARLATFHEDMHGEALLYTRQTLSYPSPWPETPPLASAGSLEGDVEVPGGTWLLGAVGDEPFVFDNEKWAHPVSVPAFRIARTPVTQSEYARFVDDGGPTPLYWRREGSRWYRRAFDRWIDLEPHHPVAFVSWHEADAYCRWAGRRLPTEVEWETAASLDPRTGARRRFPWGDEPPSPGRANLDARLRGAADVGAFAAGDSAVGCRQMIGNVWEWTASDFVPYPGFVADPYKEYSAPWFGDHKVLRGGSWATRGRMLRNTFRNFYKPDRRDVLAGFRTAAR